jgi:hypothetical protein
MTDDFLDILREEPRSEFKRALRARLTAIERECESEEPRVPARRLRLAAGMAVAFALAVAVSIFPAARATARQFLDLFRVKRFAAVSVDPSQIERLRLAEVDIKNLLSDSVEVLEDPGEPRVVASLQDATRLSGLAIETPRWLPQKTELESVRVGGHGLARLTVDAARVNWMLEQLGTSDVEVPVELDGAVVTIETPAPIVLTYRRGEQKITLIQGLAPSVTLPEGVDLAQLGEIGLRAAGLTAEEARLFSRRIDWRGTLLVPVPAQGGYFRDVEIAGARGLMISHRDAASEKSGERGHWDSLLLWSRGDKVYSLSTRGRGIELVEIADSIG